MACVSVPERDGHVGARTNTYVLGLLEKGAVHSVVERTGRGLGDMMVWPGVVGRRRPFTGGAVGVSEQPAWPCLGAASCFNWGCGAPFPVRLGFLDAGLKM